MLIFLKIYIPLFGLLALMAVFILPVWRIYRQTGKNPVIFNRQDNAHNFVSRTLFFLVLATGLILTLFSFSYKHYLYLAPIGYLQTKPVFITGFILAHISLILTMVAQYQMKSSWRVGIDHTTHTDLITHGLFRFSRNPIYTSMLFAILGFFMMMPNALSLLILGVGIVVINIQIRLEEEFLEKLHGSSYKSYKSSVSRFVGLPVSKN
ncbi:DUF1295 domain-containing protein [bacterium]|nr:DUF1295 domain-containing protein [bacterium]